MLNRDSLASFRKNRVPFFYRSSVRLPYGFGISNPPDCRVAELPPRAYTPGILSKNPAFTSGKTIGVAVECFDRR